MLFSDSASNVLCLTTVVVDESAARSCSADTLIKIVTDSMQNQPKMAFVQQPVYTTTAATTTLWSRWFVHLNVDV